MKHQTKILRTAGACGVLVIWTALLPAGAAATNATVVARARTASVKPAPAPVAPAIPQSTFVIPQKATEGKDPFFPTSTRVYNVGRSAPTNNVPSLSADLILRGISGTPEQPLAIINTTTFTTGETNEVLVKNGRVRVQCLEIDMAIGRVVLQVGSERRELNLTPLK
jgi:hypothetical protein